LARPLRLLYELKAVLSRRKFRRFLTLAEVNQYVMWLADSADIVGPEAESPPRYSGDPDDYLVVLALDTEAVIIVTEESHLHDHQDTIPVAVQNPRNFVDSLLEY
jgi:predicted nucleic acid-binding protein